MQEESIQFKTEVMELRLRILITCFLFCEGHTYEMEATTSAYEDESGLGTESIVVSLMNQFPSCEIWILDDSGFQIETLQRISRMLQPVYFISLLEPNISLPRVRKVQRFRQDQCSLILTFCRSQSLCQGIPGLSDILPGISKVLLFRRQMLLFLQREVASKRSVFFSQTDPGPTLMNDVNSTFASLGAHITLVRKWIDPIGRQDSGGAYHLVTWTPNWWPGGTPFLFDTWTKSDGFLFGNQLTIDVNHIRPNTTFKFCVPTFYMRPIFQPNDPTSGLVGTQAKFISDFAEKLRLNLFVNEAREKDYGEQLPNGDWTGAVGCISRKEADVGAGHLIFNSQRRDAANVIFGPWDSILRGVVVCSSPEPLPVALRLFMPFEPEVWACIVSTFIVTLLFAKLIDRFIREFLRPVLIWSPDWYAKPKVKKEEVNWYYFLAPCLSEPIPGSIVPRRTGYLILLGSWFIFSYFITIFFSCGLVGYLVSIPVETNVASLEDLVERVDDLWFLTKLVQQTIADSGYGVEQDLLEFQSKLEDVQTDPSMDLEIERYLYIQDTLDSCLIAEEIRSKYYLPHFHTHGKDPVLYVGEVPFLLGSSGWFLRNDMDFRLQKFMSTFAATYHSTGLFQKNLQEAKNWVPDYKHYEVLVKEHNIRSLNFSNLEIVFEAFVISLTFASVVFLAEIFRAYVVKQQR